MRREIEREEEVFLTSEKDIEDLALAVERCDSTRYGDEVGPGSDKVPCGARVQIMTRDREASVEDMRAQTVEWLRAVHVNEAVSVKMRPMGTCREPPLSPWTKKTLMKRRKADVYKTYQFVSKGKTVQEMRDLLFVALWEALFLTSCENWSEQGVANTSRADAYELGWWFKRRVYPNIVHGRLFCEQAFSNIPNITMSNPNKVFRIVLEQFENTSPAMQFLGSSEDKISLNSLYSKESALRP